MDSKIKQFFTRYPKLSQAVVGFAIGWLLVSSVGIRLGYVPSGIWADIEFIVTVCCGLMLALWCDFRPPSDR